MLVLALCLVFFFDCVFNFVALPVHCWWMKDYRSHDSVDRQPIKSFVGLLCLLVVKKSDWNGFRSNAYGWVEDHRKLPRDVDRCSQCVFSVPAMEHGTSWQPTEAPSCVKRPICSDASGFALFEIETRRRHLVITGTLTSRNSRSQGQTASSPRTQWSKSTRTSSELSRRRAARSADGGTTFRCFYASTSVTVNNALIESAFVIVIHVRYLGIVRWRQFKISQYTAKRSFYRASNSTFDTLGRLDCLTRNHYNTVVSN